MSREFRMRPLGTREGWDEIDVDTVVILYGSPTPGSTTWYAHIKTASGYQKVGFISASLTPHAIPAGQVCLGLVTSCSKNDCSVNIGVYNKYDSKADLYAAIALLESVAAPKAAKSSSSTTSLKENIMTSFKQITDSNINASKAAAFLEAGKIANNQFAKLAAKKAPMLVRGYIDTPVGKLVIANIANLAVTHLLTTNDLARRAMVAKYPQLKALTEAMMTQAYVEAIGTLNLDELISSLLGSVEIKEAMGKLVDPQE